MKKLLILVALLSHSLFAQEFRITGLAESSYFEGIEIKTANIKYEVDLSLDSKRDLALSIVNKRAKELRKDRYVTGHQNISSSIKQISYEDALKELSYETDFIDEGTDKKFERYLNTQKDNIMIFNHYLSMDYYSGYSYQSFVIIINLKTDKYIEVLVDSYRE